MDNIGFIGGGAMGEAIIKGLLAKGFAPDKIKLSDKVRERLDYLAGTYGIAATVNNEEVIREAGIIILAVKPQNLVDAVSSFAGFLTPEKILVSILAGVSTAKIEALLPTKSKVVRVMPNTPALIGAGTTVLTGGSHVKEADLERVSEIFAAVGTVEILPEALFNAVTGLSGSGPAFVYLVIEALADGGVMAGLPRDIAYKLAAGTVKGAAMMVAETKMHPGRLKDMVTSPAGTTIHGLFQLEKAGVRGALMESVLAAAKRSEEL